MITRIIKVAFIFSVISAALLFAVGFYYKDLGCDGGWYSYPALALSRGGSAVENLEPIERLISNGGVKAVFGFKTYGSIRTLYTTLWFKYISKNIYYLKVLSLFELLALFIIAYFLISKFCQDKLVVLMLMAVFINDKTILLNAASDYRPDNMVAAFSCLTFFAMLKQKRGFALISAIFASCLLMLTHSTAVIPFLCILGFFVFQNIFSGKYDLRNSYKYVLVGILGLLVFLYRGVIFDTLLLANQEMLASGADVSEKLFRTIEKGLPFIWNKELYRWKSYFFASNIAQLIVLIIGVTFLLRQPRSLLMRDKAGLALLSSIVLGFILFAVLDPHRADMHAIPLIPFFFLLLSHEFHPNRVQRKGLMYLLIGLVCLSAASSVGLAAKITINGNRSGYNITTVKSTFGELLSNKDHQYLIIGPTEIWPFIAEDRNVLIVDKTRSGKDFQIIESVLESVDYVIINKDYSSYEWEERFMRYFPNLSLKKVCYIGSGDKFVKVYELDRKEASFDSKG